MNWTEEKIKFIKENLTCRNKEIAEMLGTTESAINAKLFKLKIKRTPEQLSIMAKKYPNNGIFKKGIEVWNKGIKGLQLSPETQFKKNSIPHNALPEGTIVTRFHKKYNEYYKMIKPAGSRKLVFFSRYVWEQAYGEIPKGYIIRFKDKNSLNCELENLEMVSRKQNAQNNRNSQKAGQTAKRKYAENTDLSDKKIASLITLKTPNIRAEIMNMPEILELKRTQIILKRTIKKCTI
jgi:hypothetical protein